MKRVFISALAAMCVLNSSMVAFASETSAEQFDGAIYLTEYQEELSLGETYQFELENIRANGRSYDVDSDFMKDYKVNINVEEGDSYVDADLVKKSGDYVLEIDVRNSSRAADEDVILNFEVREKTGDRLEWFGDSYSFHLLADEDNVDEYIDSDGDEWYLPLDERYVIEVSDDVRTAMLSFDDYVYVQLRYPTEEIYAFHLDADYYDSSIWDKAPETADFEFINFKTATSFGRDTKIRIVPMDSDMKYLYEVTSNGYVLLDSTLNEDGEFEFSTKKLGTYVMATDKLTSGTSSGETNSTTNSAGESVVVDVGNVTISKAKLEEIFKATPNGGTAVLFVSDNDVLKVSDLKAVIAQYPNRAMTVVNRIDGKTTYQYRMTATQLANLTGDTIAVGMEMGAKDTTALFNKYYSSDIYVLGHNNVVSIGSNGYFAVDFSKINLDRDNLRLYWYDATRNYYDPVYTTVTFDKYDYGYFTAPVGYDIIICDGPIVSK